MFDFTINGIFNAKLEDVYNAFTKPESIIKWCAPGQKSVSQFHSHFAVDGQYRMVLQSKDGFQQTAVGTYHDIQMYKNLSFTWRWEDTNDITKVDISFKHSHSTACSIGLSQRGFKRKVDMLQQQDSWLACFEKLSLVLSHQDMPIPNKLDRYFEQQAYSSSM